MSNAKEPMALIDTTTSTNYPIVPGSPTTRKQVMHDAVKAFVTRLSEADTAGAAEESGGGIRTFTFSRRSARDAGFHDLEDVNPGNFETKWNTTPWGGQTYIMPGWNALMAAYQEEFANADPQPDVVAIVATDGALEDAEEFTQALSNLPSNMTVEIALIGQGDDNEGAMETYQSIAKRSNGKLNVTSLQGHTDPTVIAQHLFATIK